LHDGTIDVAHWLSVTATQVASKGHRTGKHGYRNVLRDLGLATTPQQASAVFFLYTRQQFFCIVSHDLYAGAPTFRACNTRWGVSPFFTERYHS